MVEFFEPSRMSDGRNEKKMDRVLWLTDGILWFLFDEAFCVKKSLILYHFGRKYGYPLSINFGVTRDGSSIKGHAWTDLDGIPYGEAMESSAPFNVIYRHPTLEAEPGPTIA